jgi:DDE family transposase
MTTAVERECGQLPEVVLADSGYYSMPLITEVEAKKVVVYVPDGYLARELNGGTPLVPMNARQRREHPGLQEQRDRLRAERTTYARRKALVEPVFGVLKQQRGMRQFRCRGLSGVGTEWALAATAFNVTRLFTMRGTK